MKFSFRQIFASAGGAVLAAVIASFFGVKGTIVGVAIGSAAATFGTAFVAQSIERGHKAVQQVVVRVPDTSPLLRRLGGTGAVGVTATTPNPADGSPLAEETTTAARQGDEAGRTEVAVPLRDVLPTEVVAALMAEPPTGVVVPVAADPTAEVTMTAEAALAPPQPRAVRWPVIAGTVAIVFVLSLMFVTAVELVAGRPLSDLFGGHYTGRTTSVGGIVDPAPAPTSTTSTSTTTTSTSTTSTSTTSSTSSTTTPPGSTTSSTDNGTGTSTTTTSGVVVTTTSTTNPG